MIARSSLPSLDLESALHKTMGYYPLLVNLSGRNCVVIGAGRVAERKARSLLECGACVKVIGPKVTPGLAAMASRGEIELEERRYCRGDLEGAFLVIAATDDQSVQAQVWQEAKERRLLINTVDVIDRSNFIMPSQVRRGDLIIAISTQGKSPALAARLREKLEAIFGSEYAELIELLGSIRDEVATRLPDPEQRKRLWYRLIDSDLLELLRSGNRNLAKKRLSEIVREATCENRSDGNHD
jgi:precorrin-2 dehydrogenase/sirohydrochlorin ferrochelatase